MITPMDSLLISLLCICGALSYALVTIGRPAPFALTVLAWVIAIPFLVIDGSWILFSTATTDVMTWGKAEMSPISMMLALGGLGFFLFRGQANGRSGI